MYRILNKINGNCYIGSSLNVEKRYKHHLPTLRHNSSRCSIL
ncbi:GIY-YIG nuclease family protein [uncultured Catenibacterium sp.]